MHFKILKEILFWKFSFGNFKEKYESDQANSILSIYQFEMSHMFTPKPNFFQWAQQCHLDWYRWAVLELFSFSQVNFVEVLALSCASFSTLESV